MDEANIKNDNINTPAAGMSEAAKLAKRAYFREWKKANRDKVRAYQERFWEKKALAAEDVSSGRIIPDPDHR